MIGTQPIGTINGFKVVIIAEGTWERRSWRERLFTLPWRPWRREKWVANPALADGKLLRYGDTIYCSASMEAELRARLAQTRAGDA